MFFNSIWCNLVFSRAADDNLISELPQSLALCFVLLAAGRTCCWDVSDEILRLWFELAYIISNWSCSENIYPSQSTITVAAWPTCRPHSFISPAHLWVSYLCQSQIQSIHTLSFAGNSLKNTNVSSGGENRSFLFNYWSLLADSASVRLIHFRKRVFPAGEPGFTCASSPCSHRGILHFQSTWIHKDQDILSWGNPVD